VLAQRSITYFRYNAATGNFDAYTLVTGILDSKSSNF
jgi:hypothetical protein